MLALICAILTFPLARERVAWIYLRRGSRPVPKESKTRVIRFPQVVENLCKSCGDSDKRMNTWDQIKGLIASKISMEAFENWLSRTVLIRTEGSRLWVGVPDAVTQDWILQEYTSDIWSAIRDLGLPLSQIVYEAQDSSPVHVKTKHLRCEDR